MTSRESAASFWDDVLDWTMVPREAVAYHSIFGGWAYKEMFAFKPGNKKTVQRNAYVLKVTICVLWNVKEVGLALGQSNV